jgi:hypothetical protein
VIHRNFLEEAIKNKVIAKVKIQSNIGVTIIGKTICRSLYWG